MTKATRVYRNRIALIFDFDDTLAPSTFHTLLSHMGFDGDQFEQERVKPMLENDWDTILARYHCLIEESNRRDDPVTSDFMAQVGAEFPLFDHVEKMFDRVRNWAKEIVEDVEVEFYMLTAGMAEIPVSTSIADQFEQIWGGACHFDEESGRLLAVKRIITHPEKTRYLTQLAKGFHKDGNSLQPINVGRDVPEHDYYVPFDQMIYVGDGGSDMPAFSLMRDKGGIAIGVVLAESLEEWRGYSDIRPERRVENLAVADYSENSELMQSIRHAVQSIAQRIALRKLSQGL